MTDLHEPSAPAVGDVVTALNEHLVPFGSEIRTNRVTKHRTGWFPRGNQYTYPALGQTLTSVGDGGLETLEEFKVRARATILSRMQYESVSGWDRVNEGLASIQVLDVAKFLPGMTVAYPLDTSDVRLADTLLSGSTDRSYWADTIDSSTYVVPLVMRVEPFNDAPVWQPDQSPWAEWVRTKRLLWEYGARLADEYGWCGTFSNVMSALGIDSTFAGASGYVAARRTGTANFPVGA